MCVWVEDMDEVADDLAGSGRVIDYVIGVAGQWRANGYLLGAVQKAVVAQSGQALQDGQHMVWGHIGGNVTTEIKQICINKVHTTAK